MTNPFRRTILCMTLVALALASATGVIAQPSDTGNVSVQISPPRHGGVLSVSISNIKLTPAEPRVPGSRDFDGRITITVADWRGDASGWSVTLAGSDHLDLSGPGSLFAVSHLGLTSGSVVASPATGHPSDAAPEELALGELTIAPQIALRAEPGEGAGIYFNVRHTDLTISGEPLMGDYQATIIVSITGTEPGASN